MSTASREFRACLPGLLAELSSRVGWALAGCQVLTKHRILLSIDKTLRKD